MPKIVCGHIFVYIVYDFIIITLLTHIQTNVTNLNV